MSHIRFNVRSEYDLYKVRLKGQTKDVNPVQLPENTNSALQKRTGLHHLDFITIIIPFFSLFFMIMMIIIVNLFKTSGANFKKPIHSFTPNIQITEPSKKIISPQ